MQGTFVSTVDIVTNKTLQFPAFYEVYIPGENVKKTDNSNEVQHVLHSILIKKEIIK